MNQQLGINWRELKTFREPNLETIQMPINGRMDKQIVMYSHKRILSNNKKNDVLIQTTIWITIENIMSNKSQTQK